jgi:hypothetical protein
LTFVEKEIEEVLDGDVIYVPVEVMIKKNKK